MARLGQTYVDGGVVDGEHGVPADPLWGAHGDAPWVLETSNLNLVADFIAGLPGE